MKTRIKGVSYGWCSEYGGKIHYRERVLHNNERYLCRECGVALKIKQVQMKADVQKKPVIQKQSTLERKYFRDVILELVADSETPCSVRDIWGKTKKGTQYIQKILLELTNNDLLERSRGSINGPYLYKVKNDL